MTYEWDETKRRINLEKHGLDLADADLVYESPCKLTISCFHGDEERWQDVAEVSGVLLVLSCVYTLRGDVVRVISLRRASRRERSLYYEKSRNPH